MPDSMDLCQGSVPATGSANKSISAPQNETHEEPGSNEEMREGATSDEEPLPRPPSPDQIQQSAELEPFIPPTKQTASLSSTACVSTSTPRTLIPAKARSLLRVWRLEAASLLLSFSCFILIIVVLAHFDQKGLPDWPLSITLNSFLAFFTTLIKATFMLPVSTAISQTKWSWFLQDRPMYDFHILDQASRGVRGSFMLLWRAHFRSFVSLGACIVIISTLTSPVTQLAINYPMRDREVPRGAYARAIRKIETPTDALAHATSKAVQLAIASDNSLFNTPMPPLETFCSTGNCTFDKYHTLGVCVKTANISSHLKIETFEDLGSADIPPSHLETLRELLQPPGIKIWKVSLSNNLYMMHVDPFPLYTDMLTGNETFGFRHDMNLLRTRVASFALIFTTPVYNDKSLTEEDLISKDGYLKPADSFWHEAWEVLFHLCVQSYDTKVQVGADDTRMVSSIATPMEPKDSAFIDTSCPRSLYGPAPLCDGNEERWNETLFLRGPTQDSPRPGAKPEAFSANYFSMELMALRLRDSLTSWVAAKYEDLDMSTRITLTMTPSDFIQSLWTLVLFHPHAMLNHTARYNCLNNIYLNVATALSSVIRRADLDYTEHGFNVTGKAWEAETYVQIRWGWLSFLAFELVLATSLLAMTIATQKHNQKSDRESYDMVCDLKDSSLAALVALNNDSRGVVGDGLGPISGLEKTAKEVHVRLRGNRLVAVDPAHETRCDSA